LPFFDRFVASFFLSLLMGGLLISDIASLAFTFAALESKQIRTSIFSDNKLFVYVLLLIVYIFVFVNNLNFY